jgi:putative intracellular protease/amidase
MSVPYVLFVATNAAFIGPKHRPTGFSFPEIAHPFHVLDQAGVAVEFSSPLGGKPPEDGFDGEDPTQRGFLDSKAYRRRSRSRSCPKSTYSTTTPSSSMEGWGRWSTSPATPRCGPSFLGVALDDGTPLVRGRKLTAFSSAEEDGYAQDDVPFDLEGALRGEGAIYEATTPWQSKLVVDGRLITGQNPQSGTVVGEALVDALKRL